MTVSSEIQKNNARILSLYSAYMNLSPHLVTREMVEELAASVGLSPERSFAEVLAAAFDLDPLGKDRAFCRDYLYPSVHMLQPEAFLSDPYRRTVPFTPARLANWELREMTLPAYTPFVYDDFLLLPDLRVIPKIGFFPRDFSYPAVLENDREWMTLLPVELLTMQKPLALATGRVVTCGLGLGYFAFMAAEKETVDQVTVVERDPRVIRLFRERLLPYFPHKEKIEILEEDAFHFAEERLPDYPCDMAFFDIWHDAGDGQDAYLRLKALEPRYPSVRTAYWMEDTIKVYLRKNLFLW